LRNAAKATFSFLIVKKGEKSFATTKIRPKRFGEIEFRVGNLPWEEIADSRLSGSSDE
jgi:hypothetical protein